MEFCAVALTRPFSSNGLRRAKVSEIPITPLKYKPSPAKAKTNKPRTLAKIKSKSHPSPPVPGVIKANAPILV